MQVLRLRHTDTDAVDNTDPITVDAKGYPWIARVIADTPVFIKIAPDAIATEADAYINEFEQMLFSVSADDDVSILGSDDGNVWISEVGIASL